VVEDRQQHRLEHHRLGEPGLDRQDRRTRHVQVAFAVAVDVAAEAVARQPVHRPGRDDLLPGQPLQLRGTEAETLDGIDDAVQAATDPVSAVGRQSPGEDLEGGAVIGAPVPEGGVDHGQLVPVGVESGRCGRHVVIPRIRC